VLWRSGEPQKAAEIFHAHAAAIDTAHARLVSSEFSVPLLQREIQPWLALYKVGASWIEAMAQILDTVTVAEDRSLHAPKSAREVIAKLRHDVFHQPYQLFGDAPDGILRELEVELSFDL
jgi:hypothetical protein